MDTAGRELDKELAYQKEYQDYTQNKLSGYSIPATGSVRQRGRGRRNKVDEFQDFARNVEE